MTVPNCLQHLESNIEKPNMSRTTRFSSQFYNRSRASDPNTTNTRYATWYLSLEVIPTTGKTKAYFKSS